MHDSLLARAARPAPAIVLGLLMRPFSIGHHILLVREGNPLADSNDASAVKVAEAALICSQTWEENARMQFDWLIGFKLWLWKQRLKRMDIPSELLNFVQYRNAGSLEFPMSDRPRPGQSSTRRPPGTPFAIRLQQFLMSTLHLSESQAWDYPLGLAKMRWQTHWEEQDGLDVYNVHDAEFDRFIMEQEAKGKEALHHG